MIPSELGAVAETKGQVTSDCVGHVGFCASDIMLLYLVRSFCLFVFFFKKKAIYTWINNMKETLSLTVVQKQCHSAP